MLVYYLFLAFMCGFLLLLAMLVSVIVFSLKVAAVVGLLVLAEPMAKDCAAKGYALCRAVSGAIEKSASQIDETAQNLQKVLKKKTTNDSRVHFDSDPLSLQGFDVLSRPKNEDVQSNFVQPKGE